jgi:xylulose-5-phosphate/fructose-6-phosphate phosphoketolase
MTADNKHVRLRVIQDHWRATNFLGATQLYLQDNPLLKRKLLPSDIKPRILGHWGTQPGLNLIYAHLNSLIQRTQAEILLVVGPGHGAAAILANLYLEGTLAEYYPDLTFDVQGLNHLNRRFCWPGGAGSHLSPATPGAIQEGGELGYSLAHAYGAVLDNPKLIAVCVVGDGEAETGPLAASWHSNKFLDPCVSGAVLPILHLNSIKLSGPTIFGRMPKADLEKLFAGYGYSVRTVSGDDPEQVHEDFYDTLNRAYEDIRFIQEKHICGEPAAYSWPMIVLKTPKGWTGPKELDGLPIEGTFRSHSIPITDPAHNSGHLGALEAWLRNYKPDELFNDSGDPIPMILENSPSPRLRMGKNLYANGGEFLKDLKLPDPYCYEVSLDEPGAVTAEATRECGKYIRDVFELNRESGNFRFFCPDETTSNRMDAIFEETSRAFTLPIEKNDVFMSPNGRVMEVLSEHLCEGWLEGYLLTGRHGVFACYEAFIPVIDSMLNQYAKWLKEAHEIPWRKPIASLNYLLTSHVWGQDHNGYSHQVPSFIDTVANKKGSVARIYLPPDSNCLASVMDHVLRSKDYVNLVIATKQKIPQWLTMDEAREHCAKGASSWNWASNSGEDAPDVVLACAGDVPTQEVLAAAQLLNRDLPELRVRVVNVVDLFTLCTPQDHPHGMDERAFTELFTADKPVIFAFHGYPRLIHELIHHRQNVERFHVHGYLEEGETTTPFDMLVLNRMSRYHLAGNALKHATRLRSWAGPLIDRYREKLTAHRSYIREHGADLPEILNWDWRVSKKRGGNYFGTGRTASSA